MKKIISNIFFASENPVINTHYRDFDSSLIEQKGIAIVGAGKENRVEFNLSVRPDGTHYVDLVKVEKDARREMYSNRFDDSRMERVINLLIDNRCPELHQKLLKQVASDRACA